MFATDFGDDDISSPELGFTFGGKKVLRRLLRVCAAITSQTLYYMKLKRHNH